MYKDSGTTFNLKDHLWTLFLHEKGLFTIPEELDEDRIYDGCHCGDCHMNILPDGSVYACRRFESEVGNALTGRLAEIFTGPQMNEYRDYGKFENAVAASCCVSAGAVGRAYGYSKNMYAADPQCWKKIA